MKSFFLKLAALLLFLAAEGHAGAAPLRILFIGNSYTGVNDLPAVFKKIVLSSGAEGPEVKSNTPGGKTLEKHLQEEKSVSLIAEGNWDVVVLQGQSEEASMAEVYPETRKAFLDGAAELCRQINAKSPRARIVFYQTWARHADYWLSPQHRDAVGKNPAEMQARNRKWYRAAAGKAPNAVVAPVGDAWELNYRAPQPLRLHARDHSHPEFRGSYLAGLVIYGRIYQPLNLHVPFCGNLSPAEAATLQNLAAQALRGGPL